MRTRLYAVVAGAILIVAGLTVRAAGAGPLAKYAGVVLYAGFLYVLVVAIRPSLRPGLAGAIALAASGSSR